MKLVKYQEAPQSSDSTYFVCGAFRHQFVETNDVSVKDGDALKSLRHHLGRLVARLFLHVSHHGNWQEVVESFLCLHLLLVQLGDFLHDLLGKDSDGGVSVLDKEVEDNRDEDDERKDGDANFLLLDGSV